MSVPYTYRRIYRLFIAKYVPKPRSKCHLNLTRPMQCIDSLGRKIVRQNKIGRVRLHTTYLL